MLLLNLPVRKDFSDCYDIVREELKSYGINFTEEFDAIRDCLVIKFKSKTCEAAIGFKDYFIRYSSVTINNKHYNLVNYGDEIIDFFWNSIPNVSGGCYFEYLSDIAVDQALFEFLDKYGFPCDVKPKQLSLFDFGLED